MLIDCHCHIQDIGEPERIREFFRLAGQAGIGAFFGNCARPGDWEKLSNISAAYPGVFPFFGIHPWYAGEAVPGDLEQLAGYVRQGRCGIGEIGLDWMRKSSDFKRQREVMARQVELALEFRVPFSVHCIGGWEELPAIVGARRAPLPFVMHAFSGTTRDMAGLIELGAYISFRHIDPANRHKCSLVDAVPLDRLLLETDFPYLAGVKPGQATPAMHAERLESLYATTARIKGVSRGELERQLEKNGTVFTDGNYSR